jgi:hypothetical protein
LFNEVFNLKFGGLQYDKLCSVIEMDNGDFLVSGYTESSEIKIGENISSVPSDKKGFIVRFDANGNYKNINNVKGNTDQVAGNEAVELEKLSNGEYLISSTDKIIKFDSEDNVVFERDVRYEFYSSGGLRHTAPICKLKK